MATKTKRWERIGLSIAVLGAAVAALAVSSLALFTDTETRAATFGTGTLNLALDEGLPVSAVFTLPAIAPGDTEVNSVVVSNEGTLSLRYAATSITTENVLAGELLLTVKVGGTCTVDGFNGDGTVLYTPGILGNDTGIALFGDVAQGDQTGDRTLAPGGSETLCFRAAFPTSATNASQNRTTSATFTFEAEQTDNNP